jgi:hypothetical protein
MKISLYDTPYNGFIKYLENEKSSGLNSDMSRNEESCLELVSSIIGHKNKEKEQFKRIEMTVRLICDDINVYEPPTYVEIGNETVDSIIWNIAYKSQEVLNNLSSDDKVTFYQSAQKRQDVIDEAIFLLVEWKDYYFKEMWEPLDSEQRVALCSHYHQILEMYYPLEFMDELKNESLFLSSNPHLNRVNSLSLEKVSEPNILAVLAISGIETVLPSVYTENIDVIDEIKETYKDEREDYIVFLRGFVNQCHLGLMSGDYKDVWDFAEYASNNELLVKLHEFERAIASSDKKLIKDVATNISGKGVSIAQSVLSGSLVGAGWSILEALVTTIKGGTARSNISSELPMVSYAYQIKERVKV